MHKLVAALLSRDTDAFEDRIQRAIDAGSDHSLVQWHAFGNCSTRDLDCDLAQLERLTTTADAQNSEVWVRVAAFRHRRGESDAALDALRQAGAAAESRIYWPETLEAAYRALTAAGGFDANESAFIAHSIAASDRTHYQEVVQMCRERAGRQDWAIACLNYGRTSEAQSRAELAQLVAMAIQEIALKALDDDRELARVRKRLEDRHAELAEARSKPESRLIDEILMTEAGLFAYIEALQAGTERSARRSILNAVERLQATNPSLDCVP